jgi:hypothetical protein
MTPKAIKSTSLALVAFATLLIVLRTINFKTAAAAEAGLWDPLPPMLRKALFLSYPVCMLLSLILFRISRKEKTRFDAIIPALYLLNGLLLLFLLVVYLTVHFKSQ